MLLYVSPPPRVVLPADVSAAIIIIRDDRVTLVADKGSVRPDPRGFFDFNDDYRKLRMTSSGLAMVAVGTATFDTNTGVIDLVDSVCGAVDMAPTPAEASSLARYTLKEIAATIDWTGVTSEVHPTTEVNTVTAFVIAGVGPTGRPEAWLTVLRPDGETQVQSTTDVVVLAPPLVQRELETAASAVLAAGPEGEEAALASAIQGSAPKTLRTAPISPDCHSVTILADGSATTGDFPPPRLTVPRH